MDLHGCEFLVLRDGAVRCRVLGLISPRPDEVEAILTRSADQIRREQQVKHEMIMKAAEQARINANQIGWPDPWWRR